MKNRYLAPFILVCFIVSSCQHAFEIANTPTNNSTFNSTVTSLFTPTHPPTLTFTQTITSSPTNTQTPTLSPLVFESLKPGEIVRHPATESNPYVFFSFFPKSLLYEDDVPILVMPHGGGDRNEDYSYYESKAMEKVDLLAPYGEDFQMAIVVVAIPRSDRGEAQALDHSVFSNPDEFLNRPDLKLIDIVWNQYIPLLEEAGYTTNHRVNMMGFSASAMFSQRFSILHPELVSAIWLGAPGIATLPTAVLDGKGLDYPMGVRNLESLTGKPFDFDSFSAIRHFIEVGELDNLPDNDTLPMFSLADQQFIISHYGSTNPERVVFYAKYLDSLSLPAEFQINQGIGHQFPPDMFVDAFNFFLGEKSNYPYLK